MPKAKPYSTPIDTGMTIKILNSTGIREGDLLLGDALAHSIETTLKLSQRASKEIKNHEIVQIVANYLANKHNKRGPATFTISETGKMFLNVSEDKPHTPEVKIRQRKVPLMHQLKKKAESLGVDISHLGTKRTKIYDYLEELQGNKKKISSRSSLKTEPLQVSEPVDPGPMSSRSDETKISPLPETLPPKVSQPIVKITPQENPSDFEFEPVKAALEPPKGRSLRTLAAEAKEKEVDITQLLQSDPPK